MSLLAPFVAALVLVGCASVEQGAQSSSDGDVSSRSPQGTGSTAASSSHEDESRSRRDESSLETRSETSTIGSSARHNSAASERNTT
jgi:hypothetical protein